MLSVLVLVLVLVLVHGFVRVPALGLVIVYVLVFVLLLVHVHYMALHVTTSAVISPASTSIAPAVVPSSMFAAASRLGAT